MRRLTVGTAMWILLAFAFVARPLDPVATAAAASARAREQGPPNMQNMMKMHEQMMAEMKAADGRLDALVTQMNATTGDAKTTAIAAVVTELVRQQKSMHDRMGSMHQQMMMGGMMKK